MNNGSTVGTNDITAAERTVLVHCIDHGRSCASDAAYDMPVATYQATLNALLERGLVEAGEVSLDGEVYSTMVATTAGRAALVQS